MRSKFSELIEQGIAGFNYTNITNETPTQDPICRTYNNIWGLCSDTHMSIAEDGNRYITGRLVSWGDKWELFKYSQKWGDIKFNVNGYTSLNDFLYKCGLELTNTILNGDTVAQVTARKPATEKYPEPSAVVAYESQIKKPLATLTLDRNEDTLKECFGGTIDEVVENLNSNCLIKGTNWIVADEKICGEVDGKLMIL